MNVMDEKTFMSVKDKPELLKCNTKLFGYRASEPLPVLGKFIATAEYKGKSKTAAFFVISGRAETLLSYQTAEDLGIIKVCNALKIDKTTSLHAGRPKNEISRRFQWQVGLHKRH